MYRHEIKNCPRCQNVFECRVCNILDCQCNAMKLSQEERDYISGKFEDCLCIKCMKDLQAEYHNNGLKARIRNLLRIGINVQ